MERNRKKDKMEKERQKINRIQFGQATKTRFKMTNFKLICRAGSTCDKK